MMVFDGFMGYEVLADTNDGWLTVRNNGHVSRILKRECKPVEIDAEGYMIIKRWPAS